MAIFIDGYNLIHLSGLMPDRLAQGDLERSRRALVSFLVDRLTPSELSETVVVFDASDAPPGLPREVMLRGVALRFAPPGEEADDVLEEMIRRYPAPRKLVVVSSDHRLQKAARRRGATGIDSEQWYDQVQDARRRRALDEAAAPPEPEPPLIDNPFPEGYGEDLLDE